MPRARLGVILALPAPVASEVDGLRRALGDRTVDGAPAHITLVPPVNVAPQARDEALARVREAAAASPPLSVGLGPAATFWPATPVVYLGVDGDVPGIHRLHDALDGGPWARPTTWPFVPHITLAQEVAPGLIPAAVQLLAGYRREAALTSVRVMYEELDGSWSVLDDVALSGRHIVGRGGLELVLQTTAALDASARRRLAGLLRPEPSSFAIEARREGTVVGAAAGATDGELWLDQLVVDPAARHQGVGGHLLRAVEVVGASRGCGRAFAVCPAGGTAEAWIGSRGWRRELQLPRWSNGEDYARVSRDL